MTDALEDHVSTVSIGGRTINNLRFADDIDGLAGNEEELVNLVKRLDETSTRYGMEISAEKTKLMRNSDEPIKAKIVVGGQKLETVQQFNEEEKTKMVWPHNKIKRPVQDNSPGNSSGEEEKRAAEKEVDRQDC
ncbi:uncharacterized protein [Palaemon carinicauda]|uniref:uncharacterized protein n=1 Tax=Palaemon carinicauda TaxID=392227 RepID=UPI0035B57A26